MRSVLVISILVLFTCCAKQEISSYDCYLDHLEVEQKKVVVQFNTLFYSYIDSKFIDIDNRPDRIRMYCSSLFEDSVSNLYDCLDTTEVEELLNRMYECNLIYFQYADSKKDSLRKRQYFNSIHFDALRSCDSCEKHDTIVKTYLNAYDNYGDLSPGAYPTYIINRSTDAELLSEMNVNLFVLEYFVPILRNRFINQR